MADPISAKRPRHSHSSQAPQTRLRAPSPQVLFRQRPGPRGTDTCGQRYGLTPEWLDSRDPALPILPRLLDRQDRLPDLRDRLLTTELVGEGGGGVPKMLELPSHAYFLRPPETVPSVRECRVQWRLQQQHKEALKADRTHNCKEGYCRVRVWHNHHFYCNSIGVLQLCTAYRCWYSAFR